MILLTEISYQCRGYSVGQQMALQDWMALPDALGDVHGGGRNAL